MGCSEACVRLRDLGTLISAQLLERARAFGRHQGPKRREPLTAGELGTIRPKGSTGAEARSAADCDLAVCVESSASMPVGAEFHAVRLGISGSCDGNDTHQQNQVAARARVSPYPIVGLATQWSF
jgi:hypothetical protein